MLQEKAAFVMQTGMQCQCSRPERWGHGQYGCNQILSKPSCSRAIQAMHVSRNVLITALIMMPDLMRQLTA